jgi:Pyruvate/2-oxoacid:ferredoxin oxidoreductase delta subunit
MKLLLWYYSGAGNTEFIARRLSERLAEQAFEVTTRRITVQTIKSAGQDDSLLVIGFPVYDLKPPDLVRALINSLRPGQRPVAWFCTKALLSADSIRSLMDLAQNKGFFTIATAEYMMPATDMLAVAAKKGSLTEKIIKFFHSRHLDKKLDVFTSMIIQQNPVKFPKRKWYLPLERVIPNSIKQSFHGQYIKFRPLLHSIPERCEECMQCVKACPRENIRFEGTIKFGSTCDFCLRCFHHCPTESIQIGDLTEETVRYNLRNAGIKGELSGG